MNLIRTLCLSQLLLLVACDSPAENSSACDSLARDACLKTVGCFLDYGGQPDSYVCRAAKNNCESLTNNGGQQACGSTSGCTWSSGSCYCPAGLSCFCGGGPPPMCRAS